MLNNFELEILKLLLFLWNVRKIIIVNIIKGIINEKICIELVILEKC